MLRICENCIHNKVCNEWAVTSGIPFVNANTCENFMTADVVPRAELAVTSFQQSAKIATLTAKLESREAVIETLRDISEHLAKMLDKMIVKTRSDVAREIIDDLASEGLLNVESWGIAELKKKYTEK